MKPYLLDTNIFLRYFLDDVHEQTKQAEQWFKDGKSGICELTVCVVVFFEIDFVIRKVLQFKKEKVIEIIEAILNMSFLKIEEKETLTEMIKVYALNNVDLTDCFLLSKSLLDKKELLSFDKDYKKLAQ